MKKKTPKEKKEKREEVKKQKERIEHEIKKTNFMKNWRRKQR
jgi:hypothetical protein